MSLPMMRKRPLTSAMNFKWKVQLCPGGISPTSTMLCMHMMCGCALSAAAPVVASSPSSSSGKVGAWLHSIKNFVRDVRLCSAPLFDVDRARRIAGEYRSVRRRDGVIDRRRDVGAVSLLSSSAVTTSAISICWAAGWLRGASNSAAGSDTAFLRLTMDVMLTALPPRLVSVTATTKGVSRGHGQGVSMDTSMLQGQQWHSSGRSDRMGQASPGALHSSVKSATTTGGCVPACCARNAYAPSRHSTCTTTLCCSWLCSVMGTVFPRNDTRKRLSKLGIGMHCCAARALGARESENGSRAWPRSVLRRRDADLSPSKLFLASVAESRLFLRVWYAGPVPL
mmetsp:Transcript_33860/g.84989  ORF Transcript_33860/g.84989 Transcript_33860/m.84989 type:complete len:339 (-) Transcript_33860:1176-2192(-)